MTRARIGLGDASADRVVEFEGQPAAVHGITQLRSVTLAELLAMDMPPRTNILDPWLPSQGLAMIHAPRGIGKTHVALGVAYAACSAGNFLVWHAPAPVGVLYLDGEMPATAMQERLAQIADAAEREPVADLRIITPDLQTAMPDLATETGQALIDAAVMDDTRLIIVDNLSTLVRGGVENEAESWLPVQTWALRHRAAGRAVLFIHHSGKGGQQRGTSRREDVLDTVIALRRPADYSPEQGARFEVHFEKARGIHGADAQSFEARLQTDERGNLTWTTATMEESTLERVISLHRDGLDQKSIAIELSIDKSRVSRHLKRAREEGLLSE